MKTHPAAELFPIIDEADFIRLCKDIRENGLRVAIVKHPDGTILDGRNRLKACEETGIKPTFVEWTGKVGTEIEYVVSMNMARRHLTTSQRSVIAAEIANMRQGKTSNASNEALTSQPKAAEAMKVSRPSVQRAKAALAEATPAQVKAMKSGEKTVSAVMRDIHPPKADKPMVFDKDQRIKELEAENTRLELRNADLDKQLMFYSQELQGDEKLVAFEKKIKDLTELKRQVEERNVGLQNEKAQAVAECNRLRRRLERFEKGAK